MGSNRKLDKIIVVDLEATAWGPKCEQGKQITEIIELGACFLNNKTGEVSQKTSYIIRPKHSTISKFCEELTTITQDMVNKGIPFGDGVNKFKKDFGLSSRVWASWGDYDRRQFEKDCRLHNIEYPFKQTHINAKNLHALRNKLGHEKGLGAVIEGLGWQFEGTHHRGVDDAVNAARVLWELIK